MAAAGMMQTDQLTRELSRLANRVQGWADKFEDVMPEIRDKVLEGERTTNGIAEQLRESIDPPVASKFD